MIQNAFIELDDFMKLYTNKPFKEVHPIFMAFVSVIAERLQMLPTELYLAYMDEKDWFRN
jgi:hypothetical protein